MFRVLQRALPLLLTVAATAQHGSQQSEDPKAPMYVAPASAEGREQIVSFQLADGLMADLVAAEPDVCNGVAFAIDGNGRFYICETFRINDGVFDNRNYMQGKDRDLACKTVAERVAKFGRSRPIEARARSTSGAPKGTWWQPTSRCGWATSCACASSIMPATA